jgi:hypothetical protein
MNNYEWIIFRRIWTAKVAKLLYIFIVARNKTANKLQINLLNKYALSNEKFRTSCIIFAENSLIVG